VALRLRLDVLVRQQLKASRLKAETEGEHLGHAILGKASRPHSLVARTSVSESFDSGAGSWVQGACCAASWWESPREVVEGTPRSLACRAHGHPARRSSSGEGDGSALGAARRPVPQPWGEGLEHIRRGTEGPSAPR